MNRSEKKHNDQFFRWKPFATSTPLKLISDNQKSSNGNRPVRSTVFVSSVSQKDSDISKSIHCKQSISPKIKTTRKNRSKAYFDLSSSSGDDDDNDGPVVERGPLIKIGSENTDKVKVVLIKDKINKSAIRGKVNNPKCQFGKECQENNETSYVTSNFFQRSKEVRQVNKVTVQKTRLERKDELHKYPKNKETLLQQTTNGGNSRKRREVQTVLTNGQELITEICTNSSHQLFTDSIQEELINTLCLTTPEMDEFITNTDFSNVRQKSVTKLKKNKPVKPASSKESKPVKDTVGAVEKQGRPKRTRQAPKKYWIVDA